MTARAVCIRMERSIASWIDEPLALKASTITGTLWLSPLLVPTLGLVLPSLLLLEFIQRLRVHRHAWAWSVVVDVHIGAGGWLHDAWRRAWHGWSGLCLPGLIMVVPHGAGTHVPMPASQPENEATHLRHEMRHTAQWMLFGPLFPIAYLVGTIIGAYRGHAYRMNPFEVDARKASILP